jgi:uncharacterized DUF497 family protein
MYNNSVLIEHDVLKDQFNQEKHGLSLAQAGLFAWASALIRADTRFHYGEARYQSLGLLGMRVHLAVFTVRDDA